MPELPDVEVFRRYLNTTSLHARIEKVETRSLNILYGIQPWELKRAMEGHFIESTRRHGKYLFAGLDSGRWIVLHFGMTGYLKYFKEMEKEPPYSRLLITFFNHYHLAYVCQRQLGKVGIVKDALTFVTEKRLGPDALEINFQTFKDILEKRRGSIKSTLMNQRIIAGIGNIYSDEILFQSGIYPLTKADQLSEEMLKMLFLQINYVLKTAIKGRARHFPDSYLIHYRYKNGKCPHCGKIVEQIKVSGRTAYYCSICQIKS